MVDNYIISFVLGAIFGLYLLLVGIALMNRVVFFRTLVQKMQADDPALMAFAMLGLALGIVLVGIHTVWVANARVLITLLCWLFLLKSIVWIFASDRVVPLIKRVFSGIGYYYICAGTTIFGATLLGSTFYRFVRHGVELITV